MSDSRLTLVRSLADRIGDGCVYFELVSGGLLSPVASAHRERRGRAALEDLEHGGPVPGGGWVDHLLRRSLPALRIGEDAEDLIADLDWPVASAVAVPVVDGDLPGGLVVVIRDATSHPHTRREQRRAMHLVREATCGGREADSGSNLDFARVLDHMAAAVWVTDRAGVTTYVNDATCDLVGVPADAVVGRPMAELIEDGPHAAGSGGDEAESRDHRLLRPDGERRWVSASSQPMTSADGHRTGTVTTLTDVTRRKRAEVDLRMRMAGHEAVAEVAAWGLAGEPVSTLVHGAAVATADLLGVEHVAVVEMADDGTAWIPRAVVGWNAELIATRQPVPADAPALLALGEAKPFVKRTGAGGAPVGQIGSGDVQSAVFMGIGADQGLIIAHAHEADAFDGRDLGFLVALAEVLARGWREQPAGLPAPGVMA